MSGICEVLLTPLFLAIAQVESRNGQDPAAHGNVYQIDSHGGHAYVDDVNRIVGGYAGHEAFGYCDVYDRRLSEDMMRAYWSHYVPRYVAKHYPADAKLSNMEYYEIMAKIHNVGYRGMETKPTAARAYWEKVKKELEKGGIK